jgi:glycerol-3-phosphate acyltransferase PlsY
MNPQRLIYAVGAPVLIWLFHLDNIARLLAGTERRLAPREGPSATPTD